MKLQSEIVELALLRRVNTEQGIQLQSLQQEADQDRATMQEINSLEQRVRAMVGLESAGRPAGPSRPEALPCSGQCCWGLSSSQPLPHLQ